MNINKYYNLKNITAASVERYLLYKDWIRKYDFLNRNMMVFEKNDETIVFPANEKFSDFYISLSDVLETLSYIYSKPIEELIKEILASYHDLLEFRIKAEISENGQLPLDYASECIEGIKDLILYSACAEQVKQPVCFRTTVNAKNVLSNFRLSQTEVGSFVINIDVQAADETEQYTLDGIDVNYGIEHKVVRRIGEAISQIDIITKDNSLFDRIIDKAYESGVTANICEALLKLWPGIHGTEIETKIHYASACENRETNVIKMKKNHFYTMSEIAKCYRENESQMQVCVEGYIISLNKKKIDDVHTDRVIRAFVDVNGSMRTVVAELSDEEYRIACDAHRDGEKVCIEGILDVSKKIYRFVNVNEFKIISV